MRALQVVLALVSAGLLSCSQRPDARSRFHFWAKYVSREARNATAGDASTSAGDEVEVLRRQLQISQRELASILAEAQEEHWADSRHCEPAPEPYYSNSLLLQPRARQPIAGHPTPEACARGLQGVVILQAVIGANGAARNVTVAKGFDPELDRQAVTTLESTPWLPALLCGRPVDVHYAVAVNFRLSACSGVVQ
jgi:TonB family protein